MNSEELIIQYEKNKRLIKIYAGLALAIFLFVMLVIVLVLIFGPKNDRVITDPVGHLPGDLIIDPDAGLDGDQLNGIRAEDIMFGHYYEKEEDNFRPSLDTYELPLDIKSDVENYYDISRKIDLSAYTDEINSDGFAIIDNPYSNLRDFYSVYTKLIEEDIPVILTSDFLLYYYQNNLKGVFDEIERNTFYKNVWDIYKDLYLIASNRYEERLARLGVSNDPILEGQRLETAYLAVVLSLLQPTDSQIATQKSLNTTGKFTMSEADYFSFSLPQYLQTDVSKELNLILKLRQLDRSPLFLYPRDYSEFIVPKEYTNDAKLKNFYLATRWLNSQFPLYYKNSDCEECLLDQNDWTISMAAASYLAKDLSDSQSNKNRWAIIYKFVSYFMGLRQDITYLEYNRALEDIYGKGYVLENIFDRESFTDVEIYKLQEKIAANKFSEIEGAYIRSEGKNPKIGMRMLQDPFWPNDYIFNKLVGKNLETKKDKVLRTAQTTRCGDYRCSATALDLFNLMTPMDSNPKFQLESDYYGYDYEVQKIKDIMQGFNVFTWNTNIYWSTLDILNSSINENLGTYPAFMRSDKWYMEKDLNTALGAWVNIHVAKDNVSRASNQNNFSAIRPACDLPNFVEPKFDYLEETIARNNMLLEMMDVLKVSRDTNLAALDIEDVSGELDRVVEISKKELSGDLLNYSDCMFIENLVSKKVIDPVDYKSFSISLGNNTLFERLQGMKLMVVVFDHGDDKIMAVGPVFDYKEIISN